MKSTRILAIVALLAGPTGAALAAGSSVSNDELLYRCRLDNDTSACAAAVAPRIVEAPRASPGSYANKRMLDGLPYAQAVAEAQGLRESTQARIVAAGSYEAYQRLQGGVFADLGHDAAPSARLAAGHAMK